MKLSRGLEISRKSAWYLAQRIRETWADNQDALDDFAGPMEVDETYMGGIRATWTMQNLLDDLTELLKADHAFISDGSILKNAVIEAALSLDPRLLELLMQSDRIKTHFFTEVAGALVFDKVRFQDFVSNKAFLPDSYTAFKNRIGLTDGRGDYLSQARDVVLAWPYKDCVLEGGMTKEDRGAATRCSGTRRWPRTTSRGCLNPRC